MNPVIKFNAHCKLCTRRVAEHPPLNIPIIGDPGRQTEGLMKVLLKHLAVHHTRELKEGAALLNEFQAFRILSAFEFEDPSMTPRLENIRAAIFQIVRKNSFTDESLQDLTARLELNEEDAAKVYMALRMVRDACTEVGSFAPAFPEESKLVKV